MELNYLKLYFSLTFAGLTIWGVDEAVDLYKLKPITGLLVTIPFLSGDVSLAAMTLMSTTLESSCPKNW